MKRVRQFLKLLLTDSILYMAIVGVGILNYAERIDCMQIYANVKFMHHFNIGI